MNSIFLVFNEFPNNYGILLRVLVAIGSMIVVSLVVMTISRLYSHPLSKFPGPLFSAISNLNYSLSYLGGRQPYDILKLHEKYGPVVRVAPNELSFNSPQSWKDIYGVRKGSGTFVKSDFYAGGNFADQASSIVSERDPNKHSEMRKFLSSAFSDRSLREQEHLVSGVVDEFIKQIGIRGASATGVDMTMWTNLLTFDIIGELAFGESFNGVKSGTVHFWISVVLESMGQAGLSDFLGRFPFLGRIFMKVNPGWLEKLAAGSAKHESYTVDLINRRIEQKTDRADFMSYLLQNRDVAEISNIQLAAHASDFVIAGSETTATTLATISYYVCRDKNIREKLQSEIRTTFKKYSEINSLSTASLRYLNAICLEALRIYVPLPLGLPRVVPSGGEIVDGVFVPQGTTVSTNPFAASMSSTNFKDPWNFRPERWLGLNEVDQLEASQPFSFGPRACLGRGLGWLELRTTLAKLHFTYDLELIDDKVDWQRDSEMHLLWKKPRLMTRIIPRKMT